jgi:hypothetical protein
MVILAVDGKIEQIDQYMPKRHWQRNKKPEINLLHDTPFAAERQLEDQRIQIERNRNPQLLVPTKADRERSQVIIAKKGASRSVAVKANVLNKIVREASGVHNYTLIAPPRSKQIGGAETIEKLDPECNPKVKAYANETKFKPVICSFGHRPRSASRTFHPATMKFRLRHGEIVKKEDEAKTGFGLSVAVLNQVLHAPRVPRPSEALEDLDKEYAAHEGEKHDSEAVVTANGKREDVHGLFLSEEEQSSLFSHAKSGKNRKGQHSDQSQHSWISSMQDSKSNNSHAKVILNTLFNDFVSVLSPWLYTCLN